MILAVTSKGASPAVAGLVIGLTLGLCHLLATSSHGDLGGPRRSSGGPHRPVRTDLAPGSGGLDRARAHRRRPAAVLHRTLAGDDAKVPAAA